MTASPSDRFAVAIGAIDAANGDDPSSVAFAGVARPKELVHAELVSAWVERLDPLADEAQLLAARAHHLRRWTSPRDDYPEGRAGYLRWRAAAKRRHAADVGGILVAAGYDDAEVARVQAIITKTGLGRDPAVQVHEDALCLAFLETQLDDLAARLGDERCVEVLRKTAAKMSPAGLAAVGSVGLSPHGAELVARAVAPSHG